MNKVLGLIVAGLMVVGCEQNGPQVALTATDAPTTRQVPDAAPTARTPSGKVREIPTPTAQQLADYKQRLGDHAYHILFEAGTERAFRNEFHDNKKPGTYVSAVTGAPLFSSEDKYDSGTGWPSFVKPISDDAVLLREELDGSGRIEVIDASSGGHLGHVFDDGPADRGGMRYCMNSAAMKFVPRP